MDLQAVLSRLSSGMPVSMRLRDLIRQIRQSRTAADERAVVQKECSFIRNTFREEDNAWRCRNVAKLLYIHMLGYPAHFGQLECLKLIASPRFIDKRIGYLGAMLILDERQDVHLLITNSLKNDLNSQTQYTVGLALCLLGSVCSPQMSRDLAGEVERLLKSSNTYVRKKAALAAFHIIKRVPELLEMFIPATSSLLTEKNHGVLVSGVILIIEMCDRSPDVLQHFKKLIPNLVRILKNLLVAGYSPEHDVCGITDPFLQVKILRLLGLLGKNDVEASEAMNDILAQVATKTETTKNAGNAILYETVVSIMNIMSESGLRVLGINILGRFLLNTDKNIRYVALNTLLRTVQGDHNAMQRHRSTIVDCLKDPDISIRKRAMELCFALMNTNNISTMTKELISFLEKAEPELVSICSSNLLIAAELYSPTRKWHIDTIIKVLTVAGNSVRDDAVGSLIQLIAESSSLCAYSVQQLWNSLSVIPDLEAKQLLVQLATWTLGEYGDLLNTPDGLDTELTTVSDEQVLGLYEKLLTNHHMTLVTREYILTSLMKLSVRLPSSALQVKKLVDMFGSSMNTELQQRSIEFSSLFSSHDHLRPSLLERMPPMEVKQQADGCAGHGQENGQASMEELKNALTSSENQGKHKQEQTQNALMELLGVSHEGSTAVDPSVPPGNVMGVVQQNSKNDLLDLLGLDLGADPHLSGLIAPSSVPSAAPNIMDGMTDVHRKIEIPSMVAFDKDGLRLDFTFQHSAENVATSVISLSASNYSPNTIEEFLFQAAVPKTFQLHLQPPTGTVLSPGSTGGIQQVIRVVNPNPQKSQLRMRIRLSYSVNGVSVMEQTEVGNFPSSIWQ